VVAGVSGGDVRWVARTWWVAVPHGRRDHLFEDCPDLARAHYYDQAEGELPIYSSEVCFRCFRRWETKA